MKKRKVIYTLISCVTIIILVVLFWHIFSNVLIKADSSGTLSKEQTITAIVNGKSEKLTLETYLLTDNSYQTFIIWKHFWKTDSLELEGFENNVSLCPGNMFDRVTLKNEICLVGDIGAHSENLEIINLKNNKLDVVIFKNGDTETKNITSDVPNFKFKDYNNDGVTDLTIEKRNYDTDPLTQSLKYFYRGEQDNFIFDTNENIGDN